MRASFEPLFADQDIAVLGTLIEDALYGSEPGGDPVRAKLRARREVVTLLREQLARFSAPHFQAQLRNLQQDQTVQEDVERAGFAGLAELALKEQVEILPRYGHEGNRRGVYAMVMQIAEHVKEPQVAKLLDAANAALGMSPEACKRFRERLEELPRSPATDQDAPPSGPPALVEVKAGGNPARPWLLPASEAALFGDVAPRRSRLLRSAPRLADGGPDAHPSARVPAAVLLADLLHEFRLRPFQAKLRQLVDRAVASGQSLSDVPGRQKLVLEVYSRVLPRYGFKSTDEGAAEMWRALGPSLEEPGVAAMLEALKRMLRVPTQAQNHAASEAEDGSDGGAKGAGDVGEKAGSTARALALESELLAAYSAPKFQRQLGELRQRREKGEFSPRGEFKTLVRSAQADVLPKYGYGLTDESVAEMLRYLDAMRADPTVDLLAGLVEERLFGKARDHPASAQAWLQPGDAVVLLREQLEAPGALPQEACRPPASQTSAWAGGPEARRPPGDGSELARPPQRSEALRRFGFQASHGGVRSMMAECAKHAAVPEVARLLRALSLRLAERPDAADTAHVAPLAGMARRASCACGLGLGPQLDLGLGLACRCEGGTQRAPAEPVADRPQVMHSPPPSPLQRLPFKRPRHAALASSALL